jgi:hypothetical protein
MVVSFDRVAAQRRLHVPPGARLTPSLFEFSVETARARPFPHSESDAGEVTMNKPDREW